LPQDPNLQAVREGYLPDQDTRLCEQRLTSEGLTPYPKRLSSDGGSLKGPEGLLKEMNKNE